MKSDQDKTKEQLINELVELRQRITHLEASETEHKQITETLSYEQGLIQTLFENISDFIYFKDSKARFIRVSNRFCDLFGRGVEDIIGKTDLDLFPEEIAKQTLSEDLHVIKTGIPIINKEEGGKVRDETETWVLTTKIPWVDKEGNIIGLFGISRDITERKQGVDALRKAHDDLEKRVAERTAKLERTNEELQAEITERKRAEERLIESEERYRSMLDNMLEGCQSIGYDWRYLYVNNVVAKHGRKAKEAMLGHTMMEMYPGIGDTEMFAALRRCMEKRTPHRIENEFTFPDGAKGFFDLSIQPVPDGIFILSLDITERKRAETVLRESEEKLRRMFESITDGITVTDINGVTVEINERAVEMYGFGSRGEVLGKKVIEFVALRDRQRLLSDVQETSRQRSTYVHEYTLLKADGSEFPGELSGSVLTEASGSVVGFITIIRDITERKKMEEQLIVTDRLASLGELTSGIAHELNNPLTSVIGFSELLLDRDLPDDIKEDLEVINREAKRTAGVVRNLLTFARKHETEKRPVNINSIIEKVLELRAYEHKVSNIEINTRFASDLPEIIADGFRLQQVFINIIINAEHFMTEAHGKGTLTITTERVGDIIRASFVDDGPGIVEANLRHLFDPFFTTKEVGKGTGLGLSISYGIITEHGGRIYAESELGKGATFVVELPIPARGSESNEKS